MQQFKAGDVIMCIDAIDAEKHLSKGCHYHVRNDTDDTWVVLEETGNLEWNVERFVKVG